MRTGLRLEVRWTGMLLLCSDMQVREQSYYIAHYIRRKEEGKEGRKKRTNANNLQQPRMLRKKVLCTHSQLQQLMCIHVPDEGSGLKRQENTHIICTEATPTIPAPPPHHCHYLHFRPGSKGQILLHMNISSY